MEGGGVPDVTQKTFIANQLQKPLILGETWYILDSKWFKQWKSFVGYDLWDQSGVGEASANPGPIDNSPLFEEESKKLKEHLIDELDYTLIPDEGWNKLLSWYGIMQGQEPQARKVIVEGVYSKSLMVEVYPWIMKICENSKPDEQIYKQFSRSDTIEQLEKVMRSEFNIPDNKEVRLWNRYMTNMYEQLNKKENTLQEASLYNGQVIVLEQKNEDGTWPRQTQLKSTFTSSASGTSSSSLSTSGGYYDNSRDGGSFTPSLRGLSNNKRRNIGNTCFMNSALQESEDMRKAVEEKLNALIAEKDQNQQVSEEFKTTLEAKLREKDEEIQNMKTRITTLEKERQELCEDNVKLTEDRHNMADENEVIRSETIWSQFVAEHNLPFAVSDDFTKVVKSIFPDSNIAKKFQCARTKTTHIVKGALDLEAREAVMKKLQTQPFSLAIDESNDRSDKKFLVILARFFDEEAGKVVTRLIDMPVCNIGTAEAIFHLLDSVLSDRAIPWKNVVSFTSDNCNTMVGRKNSLLSCILEKNPHVYASGCVCHMANLCAGAAVKKLPPNIDELLIDIFLHFDKSTKRQEIYKEFLQFTDIEYSKTLKHVGTRWLSLQKCVSRTIDHYPALKNYFNSHQDVEKPGRVQRVATLLSDPTTLMYLKFLSFNLVALNEFNTTFQTDDARIGFMSEEVCHSMRKYLKRFVKFRVIREAKNVQSIEYENPENHLDDDLIAVGQQTRMYIDENKNDLSPHQIKTFFSSVRNFYMATVKKMIKHFPFDEPLLQDSRVLVPDNWDDVESDCIQRLVRRFPTIIPQDYADEICEEFSGLQVMSNDHLPQYRPAHSTKDCEESSQDCTEQMQPFRVDVYWGKVMSLTNKMTSQPRFPYLSQLVKCLLPIPNSNADCERTFSMVRKVQIETKSDLDPDTIAALLSCKINTGIKSHNFKPTKVLLDRAKRATKC